MDTLPICSIGWAEIKGSSNASITSGITPPIGFMIWGFVISSTIGLLFFGQHLCPLLQQKV